MSNRFLTTREVAELFQLHVETVYDLIAREGLPATKLGGSWRFDEGELRKWFKQRRQFDSHNNRNQQV
jgi:excisionase family DNA binding protein